MNANQLAQYALKSADISARLQQLADDDLLREYRAMLAELDKRKLDDGRTRIILRWRENLDDNNGFPSNEP